MELQDYLRVVRKRWRVIALVTLIVLGLAAALTILTTRTYSATTQFFVSTASSDNAQQLQQGQTFSQARVKSYSQLLTSPKVLDPVIADSGLKTSADLLAKNITATIPLETVFIEVTVTDPSQEQATRVAASIDKVFPQTIQQIEQVQAGAPSPVKVTVVKQATADPGPVSPKPTRNLALGLVLGLLAGFGLALLRDMLDTRVKGERDLKDLTDKTVIGGIAFDADASKHPLIVQVDPRSQRAEAFRSVRTNLQFIDVANPPKSIVVTSSVPGEGKSTMTANLALSLAETGMRVVVIEGDLRRPRLLDYLGFEGSVGLTDVLIGRMQAQDVLQRVGRTSLSVMGAGPIPPNPSELLGSANMERLIKHLEHEFDYVLIDAPPLLPVTDAAVLSTIVDGALVVVGAGIVARDQLRHALESLETVNGVVLGLVLNRVQSEDGAGAYGSYRYEYVQDRDRQRAKSRRSKNAVGQPQPVDPSSRERPAARVS